MSIKGSEEHGLVYCQVVLEVIGRKELFAKTESITLRTESEQRNTWSRTQEDAIGTYFFKKVEEHQCAGIFQMLQDVVCTTYYFKHFVEIQ